MERDRNSNLDVKYQYKYSRRPKSAGIVIREPHIEPSTDPGQGRNPNPNPNPNPTKPCCRRDPDQYMPVANVIRIIRRVLPSHAKIADDAKETIQECVSKFISFVTTEANAKCHCDYRKTITAEDVLSAMESLGFDNYAEALTAFLHRYRAQEKVPERGAVHRAPYVRRTPPSAVQRPVAQRPQPPPPPSTVMSGEAYVPQPPDEDNYPEFPMLTDYFMGRLQGGGGGCSKEMDEFDPL